MPGHSRSVDQAIARFDELVLRLDGKTPAGPNAQPRDYLRGAGKLGKRVARIAIAVGALILATMAFGLFVGPIGWTGLFLLSMAILFTLLFFSFWPTDREPKRVEYSEQVSTRTLVQQLDTMLSRRRTSLPAPAARRVDAIAAQLPLLESRLGEMDALDPLAQDARRLVGRHLPELIERYERVPAQYRSERDGEGLTVDERLVAGLDAAKQALDDVGMKLARSDLDAFETQGRFIESRYKDNGVGEGS
jgi:hypothetical protein